MITVSHTHSKHTEQPDGFSHTEALITPEYERRVVQKLSLSSILCNTVLSLFKLIAGIFGHSAAMVSDSIHSMSDVFSTLIAIVGVHMSKRAADKEHPYGHERMECVASLILGVVLCVTGLGIGYSGLQTIISGEYHSLTTPGLIALIAAILSIVCKEAMYWYTRYYAKKIHSSAFMADAWHHRSDALSSVGSLIGIGGAMLGFPILDPIASLAICLCIFKVTYDIIKDALNKMLDTSCSTDYEKEIGDFIKAQKGVSSLDMLQTRNFGNKVYIDAEISVDGNLPLYEAHAIAENVHAGVEKHFNNIKHIMIHVNPALHKESV